ncbi:hypothetical protein LTS09_013209 [Friedmanniomyces endolithicus]|nr:hypothetical protein LTS09_013209 [Friedmanniomyces endolithicus]
MPSKIVGDPRSDHSRYNQVVHEIHIPNEMREHGEVSDEVIAEVIAYLHRDGILVLANAISPSHLDDLEAVLGPEAEEIAKDPQHHFNFGKSTRNMDQAPPLIPELMYKVGSEVPNKPHPLWPFAFAFNIPLCDMSVENGSTELWIGSHRDSNIDQHCTFAGGETGLVIKPELLEDRRQHSPPIQPSTKKGSLIIRDIKLWHAGMPNRTDNPRIMLAFVYQPRWFQAPSRVILPSRAKRLVKQWEAETGVEFQATWVDGNVDHKTINSDDVDFSTRSKALRELEEMMHWPTH